MTTGASCEQCVPPGVPGVPVGIGDGGGDELDATRVCLLIGVGTLEAGQEAVVNVDDLAFELLTQLGGQHLHVTGKDYKLNVVLFDNLEQACLKCGLLFSGCDGHRLEWNAIEAS